MSSLFDGSLTPAIDDVDLSREHQHDATQLPLVDALAIAVCCALTLLVLSPLLFDSWTPRFSAVLVAAPVGLLAVTSRALSCDRSAQFLLGAIGWTIVSALASDAWRVSLLGTVGRDLSALMFIGCAALWGVGRLTSESSRNTLLIVVLASLLISGVVGIIQVGLDIRAGVLSLASGRPTGLTSNPVYFGALSAGGLVGSLALRRTLRSVWLVPVSIVLGVSTTLSGSRVALAAALVCLVGLVTAHRERLTVGLSALGFTSLALGVAVDRLIGQGRNSFNRLADGAAGGRGEVWKYGLRAWWDRPMLGYGPGQFRAAVQRHFTVDFVRDSATDDLRQAWFDAHNVVISLLVTVGLVGAALIAAWAVTWAVRCRGPLVWVLGPIALTWLLQPVSIYTLPLGCVLFGAAGREGGKKLAWGPRVGHRSAMALGACLGMWVLMADVRLSSSERHNDPDEAVSAASMYLGDPVVDDIVGQITARSADSLETRRVVLDWRTRAVEHEPNRPYWWSSLASWQIGLDDLKAADRSIARAFALQPYNVRTEQVEAMLAYQLRDEARLTASLARLCALGTPEACITDAGEVLAEAEAAIAGDS